MLPAQNDCCHAVVKLVTGDRRLKVLEIATEVGVSDGSVLNILRERLGLSKVCARWAPCFLTPVQKSFWVETCSELLAIYTATLDNMLSHLITGDETCMFTTGIHQTQNTSHCSGNTSSLLHPGSSTLNAGWKVMALIFWD